MDTPASGPSCSVVFTTMTPYPLPTQKFMVPATWKRYQLSQLINKALVLSKPVPFDFLVRGQILTTTLETWCAENGVGEVRSRSRPSTKHPSIARLRRIFCKLNTSNRSFLRRRFQIYHMRNGSPLCPPRFRGESFWGMV